MGVDVHRKRNGTKGPAVFRPRRKPDPGRDCRCRAPRCRNRAPDQASRQGKVKPPVETTENGWGSADTMKCLWIATTPRSGSNHFCDLLFEGATIQNPKEILNLELLRSRGLLEDTHYLVP